MTKDTEEQFFARACREHTLPRSDESSQPKGWIQGNTRIGPVLEITTSYLYGKHGIEVRIWSLRKDNSQSWVRISHGSNKFVIDSNYNNTEVPADLPEEQASQSIVKGLCSQIKGESKTTKKDNLTEQFNSGGSRVFFKINLHIIYWSDDRWKACLSAGGGAKKRYQYCTHI